MSSRPTWFHCLGSTVSNIPNCACTTEVQTSAKHKGSPTPKKASSNPTNLCRHQQSTKVWAPKRSIVAPTNPCFSVSYLVSLSLSWSFRPTKWSMHFSTFFYSVSLKWERYHNIWDYPTGLRFQKKRSPAQMMSKSRSFSLTSCLFLTKVASRAQHTEHLIRTVGLWLADLLQQATARTLWSTQQRGGKLSCRLEENICKLCTHQRTSI